MAQLQEACQENSPGREWVHDSLQDVWVVKDNNGWEILTSSHSAHTLVLEDMESDVEDKGDLQSQEVEDLVDHSQDLLDLLRSLDGTCDEVVEESLLAFHWVVDQRMDLVDHRDEEEMAFPCVDGILFR